ncbi:MAG: cation diffusion facilitator family transporter [Herbaspirillum sp.]
MTTGSSKQVVYIALTGNLLVALTKTGAGIYTGSSAMLSEAVHSFVDTINEVLLLYGMRRSKVGADHEHPIGYGRELYFWSFIVAVLIFAFGAGVSIYEGVLHIKHPVMVESPDINYIVLALAFVFEATSWLVSWRQFRVVKGSIGFFEAFRKSKDAPLFLVLFEDTAALIGICIAALGIYASVAWKNPIYDGAASITIGLVLAGTAVLLARESKSLLIGERADGKLSASVLHIASEEKSVAQANGLITLQLAPDQVIVVLSMEFADELRAPDIEDAVVDIEKRVRATHPEVVAVFIKPQTARTYRESAQYLEESPR